MPYQVVYHPAVLAEDVSSINRNLQIRIKQAIDQRLVTEPSQHGEPLHSSLKGDWKLRVGDYRVVYKIVEQEVRVYRIDHRKEVYAISPQRLLWRP